jgi:hypothetical protein
MYLCLSLISYIFGVCFDSISLLCDRTGAKLYQKYMAIIEKTIPRASKTNGILTKTLVLTAI